jgi:hypothetical protein
MLVEENNGKDLSHRHEHSDDDSGEQRRAVEDGAIVPRQKHWNAFIVYSNYRNKKSDQSLPNCNSRI